jgi:hypothetical protein
MRLRVLLPAFWVGATSLSCALNGRLPGPRPLKAGVHITEECRETATEELAVHVTVRSADNSLVPAAVVELRVFPEGTVTDGQTGSEGTLTLAVPRPGQVEVWITAGMSRRAILAPTIVARTILTMRRGCSVGLSARLPPPEPPRAESEIIIV